MSFETTATQHVECANCNWRGEAGDVDPIRDFWSRCSSGEIIPHGDCPECGSFCYAAPRVPAEKSVTLTAAEFAEILAAVRRVTDNAPAEEPAEEYDDTESAHDNGYSIANYEDALALQSALEILESKESA